LLKTKFVIILHTNFQRNMQKLILCFDLGGTYLKYGLATPRGEILHHSKLRSGGTGSLASVTAPFLEAAELMRVQAEKSGCIISAAGVGTPGVVEQTTGTIIGSSPNVPALVGISLKN
jgi:glucokinase